MSFTDRKPFEVTESVYNSFKRIKKRFGCSLCGKVFAVGDTARWIYCNGTPGACTGNFFACSSCDTGNDVEIVEKGIESLAAATKLAKQWGIYGPDWEREML